MRQPSGIELGSRLERFDPSGLALQVLVRAVEEEGDEGADLVTERGFSRGESWLRDKLVMLSLVGSAGGCELD